MEARKEIEPRANHFAKAIEIAIGSQRIGPASSFAVSGANYRPHPEMFSAALTWHSLGLTLARMRRVRDLIEQTGEIALPLEEHVGAFCRDIADNVGADLISIWRFDSDRTRIACEAFYDVATGEFSRGQILYATDHPIYFRGILEEQVIDAPDVYTHPLTKDLIDTYFAPHGIKSLLDFIVHRDFKPVGIICCESRGIPRQWTEADIAYLRQIATLASFALPWD